MSPCPTRGHLQNFGTGFPIRKGLGCPAEGRWCPGARHRVPTRGRAQAEGFFWVLLGFFAHCAAGFGAGCCGATEPGTPKTSPVLLPWAMPAAARGWGLPERGPQDVSSSCPPPKILAQLWALSIPPPSPGYSIKCEYTAHKEGVLKEEMLLASETGDGAGLKVVVQARVMGKGCHGAGGVCPAPPRGFTGGSRAPISHCPPPSSRRPAPRHPHAPGGGALRGSGAGVRLGAERLARLRLAPGPLPGGGTAPL